MNILGGTQLKMYGHRLDSLNLEVDWSWLSDQDYLRIRTLQKSLGDHLVLLFQASFDLDCLQLELLA